MAMKIGLMGILLILIALPVSAQFVYTQGEVIDLKVPCSDDNQECAGTVTCNITVFNPDNVVMVNHQQMSQSGIYFNYSLNETNNTGLGVYEVALYCIDSVDNDSDFTTLTYTITPSGTLPSITQGILYAVLLLLSVFFLIFSSVTMVKINGNNEYDVGGGLIKVNVNKYLKLGLFFLSYILLLFVSSLSWLVSKNFLFLTFASSILRTLFMTLLIMFFPTFALVCILALVKWIGDVRLEKMMRRGLKPRKR
jgi:hypothetical protein